jgi:hypothetical protein
MVRFFFFLVLMRDTKTLTVLYDTVKWKDHESMELMKIITMVDMPRTSPYNHRIASIMCRALERNYKTRSP